MIYSTRCKLIASFLAVVILSGIVSLLVGGRFLYRAMMNEATNRVSLDLNAAREIYLSRIRTIETSLSITSLGTGFQSALRERKIQDLSSRLHILTEHAGLDFAGIEIEPGIVLCRTGSPSRPARSERSENPLTDIVREQGAPLSGTVILSPQFLSAENPLLAERARIPAIPSRNGIPVGEVTSGMALAAAIPIFSEGTLLGIMYGGLLLNNSSAIVDTVRNTLFHDETYQGRNIGRSTIFLGDIRISTNVLNLAGERAVGTRVSREVRERVLVEGKPWTDRAEVLRDWHLTAYEPIKDIFGSIVGINSVGVLEAKYRDVRRKALVLFTLTAAAGMGLAVALGFLLADRILSPVRRLIRASEEVSAGNFHPEIGAISSDEIGILQKTFGNMLATLKDRDERARAESENRLLMSEKQASIGKLAAGVAHEINNPLTGVLTYTHLLLKRQNLADDVRADLERIADSTDRVRKIVKGLLDFARQTDLDLKPTDVNNLAQSAILFLNNQALIKGVRMSFLPGEGLPSLVLDRNQFQSVLLNIMLNALDATPAGGEITVSTGWGRSPESRRPGIEIAITDTGSGIPPEHLDKLFDPFFTTKEVGQGTGLGLAVSLGIVQRHGGSIRVHSQMGRGSTFTVWMPAEERDENGKNPGG